MEDRRILETLQRLNQKLDRLSGHDLDEQARAYSGERSYARIAAKGKSSQNKNDNVVNFERFRTDLGKVTDWLVHRRDEIKFGLNHPNADLQNQLKDEIEQKYSSKKAIYDDGKQIGVDAAKFRGKFIVDSKGASLRISAMFIKLAIEHINSRINDNVEKYDRFDRLKFKYNCRINDAISHNASCIINTMRTNSKDGLSIIINILSILEILNDEIDVYLFEDTITSLSLITSEIVAIDGFDVISAERVDSMRGAEMFSPIGAANSPIGAANWRSPETFVFYVANVLKRLWQRLFSIIWYIFGFTLISVVVAALIAISANYLDGKKSNNQIQQSQESSKIIYNLGDKALYATSIDEINNYLIRLESYATSGSRDAQFYVGLIYDIGNIAIRNSSKAERYYSMAEASGLLNAAYNKAIMQLADTQSQQHLEGIRSEFLRLARSGLAPAQRNVGIMLALGRGGPIDKARGFAWLSIAEMAGDEKAKSLRIELETKMTPIEISNSKALMANNDI